MDKNQLPKLELHLLYCFGGEHRMVPEKEFYLSHLIRVFGSSHRQDPNILLTIGQHFFTKTPCIARAGKP